MVVRASLDCPSVHHYSDAIMGAMASQITSLTTVYSTVYSGVDQRKHQISASLAFVRGIHRWPVNTPHKWPATRKRIPFDDVIMCLDVLWRHIASFMKSWHCYISMCAVISYNVNYLSHCPFFRRKVFQVRVFGQQRRRNLGRSREALSRLGQEVGYRQYPRPLWTRYAAHTGVFNGAFVDIFANAFRVIKGLEL